MSDEFKRACPGCGQRYNLSECSLPFDMECECGTAFRVDETLQVSVLPVASPPIAPPILNRKRRSIFPLILGGVLLVAVGGLATWYLQAKSDPVPATVESAVAEDEPFVAADYLGPAPVAGNVTNAVAFDLEEWKRTYVPEEGFEFDSWPKPYSGGPGFSWFEEKSIDCAARYYTYLGPLGVQAIAINAHWQKYPGFDAFYPKLLKDVEGNIFRNAFLVTQVFEGAPAALHLQPGDLIIGIDGQRLLDATEVEPTVNYRTKNVRSLNVQAGWLIDRAEGRGEIAVDVLRGLMDVHYGDAWQSGALKKGGESKDFVIDLRGNTHLRLVADTSDGNPDYGWVNWIDVRLEGPGVKPLELGSEKWLSQKTGWGRTRQGTDIRGGEVVWNGQPVENVIGTHTRSEIEFIIPAGYQMIRGRVARGNDRREIIASIELGERTATVAVTRNWEPLQTLSFAPAVGSVTNGPAINGKTDRSVPFAVSCVGQRFLTLVVWEDQHAHNGWGNWVEPVLSGPDVPDLDLSQHEWMMATTGWGKIRRGRNVNNDVVKMDGRTMDQVLGTHANSMITFEIPAGYENFSSLFHLDDAKGSVLPSVRVSAEADGEIDMSLSGAERVRLAFAAGSGAIDVHDLCLVNEAGERADVHLLSKAYAKVDVEKKHLKISPHKTKGASVECAVPPGEWRLTGLVLLQGAEPVEAIVSVLPRIALPDSLEAYRQSLSFPLDKIGSFARGFPQASCEKTQHITAMTAAWIAAQQQADGSWPRRAGYCSPALDTANCMLALLAVDDPAYNDQLRRGMEYLSVGNKYSKWSCPNGLALAALSEYYLRTKDDAALPGIRMLINRCQTFIYGDYASGHGANPGYGDGGVNYGGAFLALGLSLAKHTPVYDDENGLLKKMFWRVQQLAPDGYVPYTRSGGDFDVPNNSYAAGARGGVYLAAARLHGGPEHFIRRATEHYGVRTLGAGDQGHSTKIFSLFGSTIGLACADDQQVFQEHARRFGWSMALTRRYKGGFTWHSELLEYMGAESVMHDLYRASTYLILLNAYKKNLGITGREDLHDREMYALPKLTDRDRRIWAYYRSNWVAVFEILKAEAPPGMLEVCRTLDGLRDSAGPQMKEQLFGLVEQHADDVLTAIGSATKLSTDQKAHLSEMILGVDHRIDLKQEEQELKISLISYHPFAGKFDGVDEDGGPEARYPMSGRVEVGEVGGTTLLKEPLVLDVRPDKGVDWKKGKTSKLFSVAAPVADPVIPLRAEIEVKIGARIFSYTREFTWPDDKRSNRGVWIDGVITRDHLRHSLSFDSNSGFDIEAVCGPLEVLHRGRALLSDEKATYPLAAGTSAIFSYQTNLERVVPIVVARARDPRVRTALIGSSHFMGAAPLPQGELQDWDPQTEVEVKVAEATPMQFEMLLQSPQTIDRLFLAAEAKNIHAALEAEVDGEWQPALADFAFNRIEHLAPVRATRFRFTFSTKSKKPQVFKLSESHLYLKVLSPSM